MDKKAIGKVSSKKYRCIRCGHIEYISTNHWGECYPTCRECSWKHPMSPQSIFECLEEIPKGYSKPAPWKIVKLGDIK